MAVQARQIAWDQDAAAALATARATPADLENWQAEVTAGTAQLWRLTGPVNSYVLTRVERYPSGADELVLVAGAGNHARDCIAWAMTLASQHGLTSIRTHINRDGLQRIYERLGWHCAERVMRISTDGQ